MFRFNASAELSKFSLKKIAKKTFSHYFHLKSGFPYHSQYTFAFSGVWEISEFSDEQLNFFPFFPFFSSFFFLIISLLFKICNEQ